MALSSDERNLITRAVKRDPEAFADLYVRCHDAVLRRVMVIVRDRGDAEDITAETFLRAWNAIQKFEDRGVSILAWFLTIAERLAFKHVKNMRPSCAVDEISLSAPENTNPEMVVEYAANVATLRSALDELPAAQRDILTGRYLNEMDYNELGNATGKPAGTVRVMHHRALKALRVIMAGKADADSGIGAFPSVGLVRPVKVTK